MTKSKSVRSRQQDSGRVTGNPEVIRASVGLVPTNAHVFTDAVSIGRKVGRTKIKGLHGFTHGGKEQLVRQASGSDIISSYTDDEFRSLVQETMPIAFLTALFTTAFLNYPVEHQNAVAMFNEYRHSPSVV